MKNPIVFISYSWDNEDHKIWVLNLANTLRLNGVDVILDRYYLTPGKNLPHFVENSIKRSDRIIIVLTPEYKNKAEKRLGGVGHEYSLINNTLLNDITNNEIIIPILKNGESNSSIPSFLQQFIYQDFRDESKFDKYLESLLREIYKEPLISAIPLGKKPSFPSLDETFGHKIKILKSHIVIDIKDRAGKDATYEKNLELIALQDGLNTYNEDFGVDGTVKEINFKPGLIKKNTNGEVHYQRHPLAFLVEAADDICYTIIDFEDGINLGLVSEDYALEYLIKLVKDRIDTPKFNQLKSKEDRISYLRAVAIGSLIEDAVRVFLENEEAILKGEFHQSLTDKSKYQAQMTDIINLSVQNIYQSREVIEKEIVGYEILQTLLHKFITAVNNQYEGTLSSYDKLILKMLPEKFRHEKETLYERLLHICHYVSLLTDGNALELFETINGRKKV